MIARDRPLRHLEPSLYMHQSDQSLSWTSEVSVRFSEINLIAAICLARAEAEHTEIASKRRRGDHPLGRAEQGDEKRFCRPGHTAPPNPDLGRGKARAPECAVKLSGVAKCPMRAWRASPSS